MAARVIFLDDDPDLREVFADLMAELGVSAVTVASVGELETTMSTPDSAFDLAILDINLGRGVPTGLDAYRWLKAHDFAGRIVFLTGHGRSDPLVSEVQRLGEIEVHDKPISVAELCAIMQ
jgi:DNA-binding NtrC family response regulator